MFFFYLFSVSTTSTVVSVSSKLSSLKAQIDEEDVKSIFVGATKYEILNYLEDAKERGMDNLSTDLGTGMIHRNKKLYYFENLFKLGMYIKRILTSNLKLKVLELL